MFDFCCHWLDWIGTDFLVMVEADGGGGKDGNSKITIVITVAALSR